MIKYIEVQINPMVVVQINPTMVQIKTAAGQKKCTVIGIVVQHLQYKNV